MERNIQELQALEKVISNLVEAVKLQEKRVGYLFFPHYETKKENYK